MKYIFAALGFLVMLLSFQQQTISPYPTAPLCGSHDATEFHTLWNENLGCHYDHSHHMPYPAWANTLWGDYTQYTGQAIGYPWQTTGHGGCLEIVCKPNGYKLHALDLRPYGCIPQFAGDNGVSAFFSESHNLATEHDFRVRTHSFFAIVQICVPGEPGNDGVVIVGGHNDFGQPVSEYQGLIIPFPDNPVPAYQSSKPPYRSVECAGAGCKGPVDGNSTWDSAGSSGFSGGNQFVGTAFRQRDIIFYIQSADRNLPNPPFPVFCNTSVNCYYNGTTFGVYKWRLEIPAEWDGSEMDTDGAVNGRVSLNEWVTPFGVLDPGCTEAGLQCAPLILINAPVGETSFNFQTHHSFNVFGKEVLPETDYCFLNGVAVPEGTPGCQWSGWVTGEN